MSQTKAQLVGGVGFSTADSLTVHNGLAVTGVVTATSFAGNITGDVTGNADTATFATTAGIATNAQHLSGTPGIEVGIITASSINAVSADFSGNVTIGGTLQYEDVTNIDSIGIVTARSGINITGAGMTVTGIGTFRDSVNLLSGASVTGVVTATSFVGDITGDVTGTASNASGATGDFSIADKIVHTGDTNTAIRFPSTDTVTIETSGSEAARIDSSGRLLVGTSSSNAHAGADDLQIGDRTSDADSGMTIGGTSSSQIRFGDAGSHSAGSIYYYHVEDSMRFSTATAEAMRLDSSGRLLVGTSTASSAGNSQYSKIEVSGNTSTSTGPGQLSIKRGEAASLMSDNDTVGRLIFASNTGGDFAYIQSNVDGTPSGSSTPGDLSFYTTSSGFTPTERMRLDSSGRLLVGAASGTGKFIVQDASLPKIQSNFNDTKHFEMGVGGSGGGFSITTGHFLTINHQPYANRGSDANLTERVRVDSSGRLLVGRTSTTGAGEDIQDSKGGIRSIPLNSQGAAYTLVVGDVGKFVRITTGGVTVPSGVFSAGEAVTIYNHSSSDQTITQGSSVTLRSAGTADTGNRTLAQRGVCTVLCVGTNDFVISGAGLS